MRVLFFANERDVLQNALAHALRQKHAVVVVNNPVAAGIECSRRMPTVTIADLSHPQGAVTVQNLKTEFATEDCVYVAVTGPGSSGYEEELFDLECHRHSPAPVIVLEIEKLMSKQETVQV